MVLRKYGRKFKNKTAIRKYIRSRIRSWKPILKTAPRGQLRTIKAYQNHWRKELKKL